MHGVDLTLLPNQLSLGLYSRAIPARSLFALRPATVKAVRRGVGAPLRPAFDPQYRCSSRTTLRCVLPHCAVVGHVPKTNGTSRRLHGVVLLVRKAFPLPLIRAKR